MASASPPPPPAPPLSTASPRSYDLDITVISAKHLKNVNWRHGPLKPYAVAYLQPDRRSATKPDDSGSTRPVWNERLSLPLPLPFSPHDPSLLLTIDIFHSKPSETPKPLVGSARIPLKDLIDPDNFLSFDSSGVIRSIELCRPSGRPQGKVRIKLSISERPAPPPEPNYQLPPPPPPANFYYSVPRDAYRSYSPPPPPAPQHVMPYSHAVPPRPAPYPYPSYPDHYSGYYSSTPSYYSAAPPPPPAPQAAPAPVPVHTKLYYDRPAAGYGGPSAPVDYNTRQSPYDDRSNTGKFGHGTGVAVGSVAGAFGGMTLEEGIKHEEEKVAGKLPSDHPVNRDSYSEYRADY